MYSTLQRLNLVTAFALSVISVLLSFIALTGLQIGLPSCTMKINQADMYGSFSLTQCFRASKMACR